MLVTVLVVGGPALIHSACKCVFVYEPMCFWDADAAEIWNDLIKYTHTHTQAGRLMNDVQLDNYCEDESGQVYMHAESEP